MSEHLDNMVDAIVNNDGIGFKREFDSAMNELVAEKIQERKVQIAGSLVGEPTIEESTEDEELDEYIQADGTRRKVKGGDGRRTGVNKVTEEDDEEVEEDADAYEKFFRSALKKFGVKSPADFKSDEEKKKFFDFVDKEYKADKEED